jgi:hypothetical protein
MRFCISYSPERPGALTPVPKEAMKAEKKIRRLYNRRAALVVQLSGSASLISIKKKEIFSTIFYE